MLTSGDKSALLHSSLEIAAKDIGDITRPVIELFYRRSPAARDSFARHAVGGDIDQLEASMVETCLYCIMQWIEQPKEVEIVLRETVPHHLETLDIEADQFSGLLQAVVDTLATAIPQDWSSEHEVLQLIRGDLCRVVETSL